MRDLDRAKQMLLEQPTITCVVCGGELLYVSEKRGIAPMMDFLDAGYDMQGFSVADRIVGRAAAMLFALSGIRQVYAEVMSEGALTLLQSYQIQASYGVLTPYIINRKGNGACPMEEAVCHISDPVQARAAIRNTMKRLKERGGADTLEIH